MTDGLVIFLVCLLNFDTILQRDMTNAESLQSHSVGNVGLFVGGKCCFLPTAVFSCDVVFESYLDFYDNHLEHTQTNVQTHPDMNQHCR